MNSIFWYIFLAFFANSYTVFTSPISNDLATNTTGVNQSTDNVLPNSQAVNTSKPDFVVTSLPQDLPQTETTTEASNGSSKTTQSPSTLTTPNGSENTTITAPPTNTTVSPPTNAPTTVPPAPTSSPTTSPATNSTTITPPPVTTPYINFTTLAPTLEPTHDRKFDGPSFFGGMVLTIGLTAIGFVAFKFYKSRNDRYHTL